MAAAAAAAVVAADGGAATWSAGSGALVAAWSWSSAQSAAVAAVLRGDGARTNRVAVAVALCYCGAPRTPRPVIWPPCTRVEPQSIASATADVRVTGHVRSCLPPTPNTWPPRPHTP